MRKTRSFAEVNGPWGDRGSYHFEALWSDSVIPHWVTQPSYPGFHHLTKGLAQIGPEHPGRREFCGRHGGAEGEFGDECAGSDNWYFRGRPFGYGSTARTLTRKSRTWPLAFSLEGEFDGFGGREMTYDLGVSWSRSENNLNKPGIFTERMFLAFRGYGGPDCGVGVVPDRELAQGMRLGPTEGRTPGADGCLYYNPFSNALEFSDQPPGSPFHDLPNPDYRPELANDPELVRWLNGGVSDRRSETELLVGDFALSGSWIEDRLGYALGYQFRRFVAEGDPNELGAFTAHPCPVLGDLDCGLEDRIGPYITTSMNYPYREDQTVHRVFGELAIQLSEPIDVQLAADYERYDQASSVDPKLALRWRLSDYLTLTGSVQTTFRTPSVDDLTPDVPLTTYQYARPAGTWVPIDRYGDPDLDPERAFTFNLGLIAFPTPSIELTVDYWNYDFKDVIGDVPHNLVVRFYNDPATRDQVSRYLHCRQGRADPPGVSCAPREIVRVELPLLNWPGVETAGMDWQLSGWYEWGPAAWSPG
ncbi:MAG: TonB-dependent receptor [Proteobacteria bacterium]|nr:TonB-dependent receptor [Pseudomonadota bacterium]